jgi:hypothetical protein
MKLSKRDYNAVSTLLNHARNDIELGGNGTYSRIDKVENEPDYLAINKAKHGINVIKKLLGEGY